MNEVLKDEIFLGLKSILKQYVPPMKLNADNERNFELIADKKAELDGRKRENTFFASACKMKDFVGFYLFHIYMHPELLKDLPPGLRKKLKGKSCFHIKQWNGEVESEVKTALEQGLKCYKEKSYV